MCDQLKVYKVYTTRNEGAFGFCEGADITDIELEHESVCLKSDVDKVIAGLKAKLHDIDNQWNEQCKEIAQLKAENEQLKAKLESVQNSMYCDVVDANMKIRKLSRSLWLARALFNGRSSEYFSGMASRCKIGQEEFYQQVDKRAKRYLKASYKCQAMADKFK